MTLFKFAGDKEETRNLLVEISKKNPKQDGIRPVLVTEALAMACQTAYDCGWSVLARDSLEFMIDAKKTQYTIDHELLSARHNFGNDA